MDYIKQNEKHFADFITGSIDEYIEIKKQNGIWGDDVEIQALSEIYDRPIEIYSYSNIPLKTFHEKNNM